MRFGQIVKLRSGKDGLRLKSNALKVCRPGITLDLFQSVWDHDSYFPAPRSTAAQE
jgi:hypothetical protein